jgi:leucyl-tRNA synthetase
MIEMSENRHQDKVNLDLGSIEQKWRNLWNENKIFESEVDFSKEKYFITVAYPYPNSPQHVGHGRTYTLADVHARYMRMKGYNVLFPMGFHYTGTPIVSMSQRVLAKDSDLIETFRNIYNLSDETISTFITPERIASFFHNEIKQGMEEMGYSIDWRREFTTIDEGYAKFISWQFRLLREKGLIVQGSHPVGWCPKDHNPVSQHDTMGDVEPDFLEYTLIKYTLDDGCFLPAATLRPETIFGVTNLWINPNADYVEIGIDGERWIVTPSAADKLQFLNHNITVIRNFLGRELVGKIAMDSFRNVGIPIYPALFVNSEEGTGIVMSVPGHAPFDYQALEDLKMSSELRQEYNIKNVVSPVKIINSKISQDDSDITPAAQIVKEFTITDQMDQNLEKATNKIYSEEFYSGTLLSNTGSFAGISVKEARSKVKEVLSSKGLVGTMYELVNKPVRCRCGTTCVVKLLTDQWFLNYQDKTWKKLAHDCIDNVDIIPDEIRQEFNNVIDWLKQRACARKIGLGTKLPWDPDWIVESLSDSVIYMAYYLISRYLSNPRERSLSDYKIQSALLNDDFFSYIMLGVGDPMEIANLCNIPVDLLKKIKEEFLYFYPVDSRHSGRDLVPNHLSFFIFNHVAIFKENLWPKQIVVNGSVLMQGKKMSKSLGNIIPLRTAIKLHGADPVRLAMLSSSELLQDADFSFDLVKGIRTKLLEIYGNIIEYATINQDPTTSNIKEDLEQMELEDKWLLSRLQDYISLTTRTLDRLRVRETLQIILYYMDKDLTWYRKRKLAKKRDILMNPVVGEFYSVRVKLLAPFAPFISEEIWHKMKGKGFISLAPWPQIDPGKINPEVEEYEALIQNIITDIQNIIRVTKIRPNRILIYTASKEKWILYKKILNKLNKDSAADFGELMRGLVMDKEARDIAKSNPDLAKKILADILSESSDRREKKLQVQSFEEGRALSDALALIKGQTGYNDMRLDIVPEDQLEKYDPKQRSKLSRPFKPALYIE